MLHNLQWSVLTLSVLSCTLSKPVEINSSPYGTFASVAMITDHPHGTIDSSYIVLLKDDLPVDVKDKHMGFLLEAIAYDPFVGSELARIDHVYDGPISGYSGRFSKSFLEQIRRMPEVQLIEKDQIVQVQEIQRFAPWGLARISHRQTTSTTSTIYEYDSNGGEGIDAYIIDTGININHVEFEGRASWGKTIPDNTIDEDENGHGTHVAGIVASRKYGVAKKANLIAVKVLGGDGSGSLSDVIAGVVWAANAAKAKAKAAVLEYAAIGRTKHKGSVANLSLGSPQKSLALNDAVNKAVQSGLHFAVAAGSEDVDACNSSPASSEQAVTVGASTLNDERATSSNHGRCVNIFAPGTNILSTYKGSDTATMTLSGTSMASSHVAGLLAYFLSIYPSETFDPTFDNANKLLYIKSQRRLCVPSSKLSSRSLLYSMVHQALPSFISSYLPAPDFIDAILGQTDTRYDLVPIRDKPETLTPAQLKQALLAIGSKDTLSGLPVQTVNLLAFNNATVPRSHSTLCGDIFSDIVNCCTQFVNLWKTLGRLVELKIKRGPIL